MTHCSPCPTASSRSPASPGRGLQGWDCSQEVCRQHLLGSWGSWVVMDFCQGLASHCPQALWGQGPCLGQQGVLEHVALLSALLTLSLSLCLSLSLSRSCRRHFCDLQLVIWLQLHSHKSDRWQPCLLHGACREPRWRLAPSFVPHRTRAAPLSVLPLLPSLGWAPEEPGSSPGPFLPHGPPSHAQHRWGGRRSRVPDPQGHITGCPLPPPPARHSEGHLSQPCPRHGRALTCSLLPCRKVNKCYRGRSCPIIVHCRYRRGWRWGTG